MKKTNKYTILVLMPIFFLCVGFFCLSANENVDTVQDVDPFYIKIFEEGKNYYFDGKFQKALENFKVVEFGLLDEKKILTEVYLFYSLAQFRLERRGEARKILKKLETELNINIKNLNTLPIPRSIKTDVKIMVATLSKSQGEKESDAWKKIYSFELLFWNTLQKLDENKFDAVKNNIKKLEKLDKKDTRIFYIDGIYKFRRRKYKACIKTLNRVKPSAISSDPSLPDNLYFYLALSYYYLENKEESRKFHQKISNQAIKANLEEIIKNLVTQEKEKGIDKRKNI
jgi:hypothetical protein